MSKNIIVIGAGISGLIAAIALSKLGYCVRVFEKAKKLENIGGAFALFPNGINDLRALGLGHIIDALAVKINYASNFDANGEPLACGSLSSFYQQTGEKFYTFERAKFQQLLVSDLQAAGVTIEYQHTCAQVGESKTGVSAHFTNGTVVHADYLWGADGIHSNVRACVCPEIKPEYTGICAFGGILNTAVDLSEFGIGPDQLVSHFGPDQSLWLSPLSDGRQAFYIHKRMCKETFDAHINKWELLKKITQLWSHSKLAQKITQKILAQGITAHSFAVPTYEINSLNKFASDHGRVLLIGDISGFGSKAGLATTKALGEIRYALSFLQLGALNQVNLYNQFCKRFVRKFYDLEKEDEDTDLTCDPVKISKRDEAIRASANICPMWQGLGQFFKQVSAPESKAHKKIASKL